MPKANASASVDACTRVAAYVASGSVATHTGAATRYARRTMGSTTPEWYTRGAHDGCLDAGAAAPGRRRPDLIHAADDRARADAHLLGHDVLPLRLPRDFDCALRRQRQRRLRLHGAAASGARRRGTAARGHRDPLRAQHRRRAVLAGAAARRPDLLAAEPAADADDLRARGAPLLHR